MYTFYMYMYMVLSMYCIYNYVHVDSPFIHRFFMEFNRMHDFRVDIVGYVACGDHTHCS